MNDEDLSRDQLLAELAALRRKVEQLDLRQRHPNRDVDETKEACPESTSCQEQTLSQSSPSDDRRAQEDYLSVVQTASETICIAQDGLLKFANMAGTELTGYSEAELLSMAFAALVHPDDLGELVRIYMMRLRQEYVPPGHRFRIITKTAAVKWVESWSASIRWNGSPAVLSMIRDVTERVHEEEHLRTAHTELDRRVQERTAELQTINDTLMREMQERKQAEQLARLGRWEWDIQTGALVWSGESFRAFGHRPHDNIPTYGMFMDAVHPDDRDMVELSLRDALNGTSAYDIEFRIVQPNGDQRVLLSRGEVQRDEQGQPVRMIGMALDITDYRKAEEELSRSEKRLMHLMDHSPMGIAVVDMCGNVKYLNNKFIRTFGYTLQELPTLDHWWSLAYPDPKDGARVRSEWLHATKESAEKGTEPEPVERKVRCKDGTIRFIEFRKTIVDGLVIHTLNDVTENRRQEEALRESEQMFRLLSEQSLLSIAVLQDGVYQYANQAMSDLCEYSLEEILGWGPEDFLAVAHPADRTLVMEQARLKQAGDPLQKTQYAFRIITKSGITKWVEIYSKTVQFKGNPANLLTMLDITDRKMAEAARIETENRYRSLVETSPDPIIMYDLEGNLITANQQAAVAYGVDSTDQLLSEIKHISQILDQESRRRATESMKRTLTAGSSRKTEYTVVRKDGGVFPVEINSSMIRSLDGAPLAFISVVRDITGRKRAEQRVLESEERLRLAWDTSPDYFSISRLRDSLIVEVNRGFTDLTGYGRDEAMGHCAIDLDLWAEPADRIKLAAALDRDGQVRDFETRFRRKGGEIRTVSISAGLMTLGGEPHLLATVKDIEDSKRAHEALARSEELFRKYFELGLVGMALISPEKAWVFVNDQLCEMLGYTREELLKTTWPALTHPDDVVHDLAQFDRMMAGEIEGYSLDKRFIHKDGATIDTALHLSCIRRDDGSVEHVIAHFHDITERNSAARDLRRYSEELEMINRLAQEIASSLSLEQVINRGLRALHIAVQSDRAMLFLLQGDGFALRCIEPRSGLTSDVQFPIHRIGECLCGLAVEQRRPMFSMNINHDARCTWQECKSMGLRSAATIPILSGEQVIAVLVLGSFLERDFAIQDKFIESLAHEIGMGLKNSLLFEDLQSRSEELEKRLTELREANDEKDKLQSQLVQSQKMEALGTLAGGIAHDVNNLLQAVLGYSDLLLMKKGSEDPERRKLEVIQQAARDGADLVSRILTFSRKGESKTRPLDLNVEIRKIERLLRRTLPRMIRIEMSLAENIGIIEADQAQLEQVILNLGVNAQHAMPDGGLLLLETSNVSLSDEYLRAHLGAKEGQYVLLTVSDTGEGMDSTVLERIFEPFFTTKPVGLGTGLGLSMVHGIVTQHGGYIRCYSEQDKGTSFKIYFPVSEKNLKPDLYDTREMPAFGTETILLVDDDDRIRDMGTQMIEMGGYKVLIAKSGEEALEMYSTRKGEIALIILDLIMPGMGGNRCLEELLRADPDVRVLVASGYSSNGVSRDYKQSGARGFVNKPYDAKDILGAVRKVLDYGQL